METRRQSGQPLIRLMDGQESQWSAAEECVESASNADILDIIHVAGYVRLAAKAFYACEEQREAFCRERMLRILQGETAGVIHGLRIMASTRGLKRQPLKDVNKVCGYFENNLQRMRYDEYLAAGYPIATGVIEGACRHLVKDRMERTGMRWRLKPAQSMLSVRAVFQTPYWDDFHKSRMAKEQQKLHPYRHLVNDYQPQLSL